MSVSARSKIQKDGEQPTTFELSIAQALFDLEASVPELKADLHNLHISSATEVTLADGRHVVIVYVPQKMRYAFRKAVPRLVRELEKKLSGKHVVFLTQRKQVKGESFRFVNTTTQQHKRMLEDLVYPTEIVGKRIRVKVDGSQLLKVLLDKKDQSSIEYKVDTYAQLYERLTGKAVAFEFPAQQSVETA